MCLSGPNMPVTFQPSFPSLFVLLVPFSFHDFLLGSKVVRELGEVAIELFIPMKRHINSVVDDGLYSASDVLHLSMSLLDVVSASMINCRS